MTYRVSKNTTDAIRPWSIVDGDDVAVAHVVTEAAANAFAAAANAFAVAATRPGVRLSPAAVYKALSDLTGVDGSLARDQLPAAARFIATMSGGMADREREREELGAMIAKVEGRSNG